MTQVESILSDWLEVSRVEKNRLTPNTTLDQEHPVDEDLDYPDHSSNSQSNLSKQTNPMQPGILY